MTDMAFFVIVVDKRSDIIGLLHYLDLIWRQNNCHTNIIVTSLHHMFVAYNFRSICLYFYL